MALHPGDSAGRGGRSSRRVRLLQRVHVTVELGGVVGHLDPDVPRVDLRSGTCTLFSSTCAMALAMSESSRGTSASLTFNSLATALTP